MNKNETTGKKVGRIIGRVMATIGTTLAAIFIADCDRDCSFYYLWKQAVCSAVSGKSDLCGK